MWIVYCSFVFNYEYCYNKEIDKYEEVDEKERIPYYEQKKWEEEQMSSAVFRFGARKKKESEKEYSLIIDNQIEFVQVFNLPGTEDEVIWYLLIVFYFRVTL